MVNTEQGRIAMGNTTCDLALSQLAKREMSENPVSINDDLTEVFSEMHRGGVESRGCPSYSIGTSRNTAGAFARAPFKIALLEAAMHMLGCGRLSRPMKNVIPPLLLNLEGHQCGEESCKS